MPKVRSLVLAALMAATVSAAGLARPARVAGGEPVVTPTATLDGRPIPLADVSKYYCDDFAYPQIRCSSSKLLAEVNTVVVSLLSSVDYVTIYDATNFNGAFMSVSQDYPMLVAIGWNDKVSSFKGRNSETGRFWTDWFNGGSSWSFCCNAQVTSLGSYDNTFSSVQRT